MVKIGRGLPGWGTSGLTSELVDFPRLRSSRFFDARMLDVFLGLVFTAPFVRSRIRDVSSLDSLGPQIFECLLLGVSRGGSGQARRVGDPVMRQVGCPFFALSGECRLKGIGPVVPKLQTFLSEHTKNTSAQHKLLVKKFMHFSYETPKKMSDNLHFCSCETLYGTGVHCDIYLCLL